MKNLSGIRAGINHEIFKFHPKSHLKEIV